MKFKFGFQIVVDDGVVKGPEIDGDGLEWDDLGSDDPSKTVAAESLSEGEIAPIGVAKFQTELGEDIESDPFTFGFQTAKPGDTPGELEPQLKAV